MCTGDVWCIYLAAKRGLIMLPYFYFEYVTVQKLKNFC